MDDQLYELSNNVKDCKNANQFINLMIDRYQDKTLTSKQKENNFFYCIGMIDTLYFCKKISQKDYINWLKYFGL